MTAAEFSEWRAYDALYPIGSPPEEVERADYWRAALVASTIANVNRGKGKRPFKVEDFMPAEPREAKSQKELQRDIDAAMAMFGGKSEVEVLGPDGNPVTGGKTTAQQRPKGG